MALNGLFIKKWFMKFPKYAPWMVLMVLVFGLVSLAAFESNEYSYTPPAAQNIASRPYTKGFRPNRQRDCIVSYSVVITTSPALLAASGGRVTLQMSPDSTNWTTIMSAEQTFPAGVALPATTGSVALFGLIKAGQWCRITTTPIAGSPSFSTPNGTELSF